MCTRVGVVMKLISELLSSVSFIPSGLVIEKIACAVVHACSDVQIQLFRLGVYCDNNEPTNAPFCTTSIEEDSRRNDVRG